MPGDLGEKTSARSNNGNGNNCEFLNRWMWETGNVFYSFICK